MSLESHRYIIANILAHCSLRDQFRAKRVCRKWSADINISTWPEIYTRLRGKEFPWFMYMLQKYSNRPWNWPAISGNPSIVFHEIFALHPEAHWDMFRLSRNSAITWSDITSPIYSQIKWKNDGVSQNPNITIDIIRQNPEFQWNPTSIMYNPSICWEDFYSLYSHIRPHVMTEYFFASRTFRYDIISAHDMEWNWYAFSIKDGITEDMVAANLDKNWSWMLLSKHPNITWEFMMRYPDKPWVIEAASRNPNITLEIILNNPDKGWDWHNVAENSSITCEMVLSHPDLPWRNAWNGLSLNPSTTWADVENNPEKPWNFHGLSANPSITWADVCANMDRPWDWHVLSSKK
jgi:F-box domain